MLRIRNRQNDKLPHKDILFNHSKKGIYLDPVGRFLFNYFYVWFALGVWDDRIPTSAEWTAFAGWFVDGTWDDNYATTEIYSVWDDGESTV
jgi:hypothetical protein